MTILRTLSYPLAVKNGSLQLSENFDCVKNAIFAVLEVRPGELVMRPRFGSPDFVFDAVQHPQAVISRIQTALEEQIPDVEFVVSGEIKDDGAFNVQINWNVDQIPQAPIQFMLASENFR